ncbi:DNA polymerase III subunit alpha [Microbulbifer flavimaris]|uniref:DNA polymerase III subunit alpha n=1 Tax=Microbulbifer flavimaris TaxID=1781068 RepID=A0ABX4HWQ9_9GAMM|nr:MULTISPECIES: DNA polymerase III subunit alpha [Microbulbifer]KUJ81637.1 DNA polymerase III subunit alpha [Microbulbifer sp. ZGT114]PCO04550.1 DNA polymerase III subunit alpha [Microbulbifer flavimaris]
MTQPFVHLRTHSEYSLIDGLVRIKPLVARAAELEMPALALTDQTNFYGQIKFYKACLGAGIKPITGADFWLSEGGEENPTLITLYAMNARGYLNITELISRAWMEGQYHGNAYIRREWLPEYAEGVLALSGAKYGDVGRALIAGRSAQAEELARDWAQIFPDRYYLELQRTGRPGDEDYLHAAVSLAQRLELPVVATNDVRFLEESEFEAHEVRVCIHDGRALDDPRRERRYSPEQYFRTVEEMQELFSDIPEALENTVEIARRCSAPIQLGKYFLPEYPIPEGMTENQFFEKISFEGLDARLETILDRSAADYAERRAEYEARLRFELDIIIQMGFPGYFLIVMDFIQWAKDHDIPVGPGRGSGAGSLVAYVLKITDLDPLQYDLLFERFLNPERVSMPDFDVDFCMEKRDRVIGYVADNYGRNAVSQIITFGTMAAKAVVRDVARVQGKSYGLADKLSKMIPPDPGMTLEKAFEQEDILREFLDGDEEGQEIWEMALQLEGVARNVGKHAGGVVIAPTKLTDFAPLYCDETGAGLVTQFDKNDVEDAGLVKFDFLGLRTLTIIDWAKDMVDEQRAREGKEPLVIEALPLDDAETYKMIKRAETTAVFQLESRGMKDLIKRLQPDNLEDMIALVALFRPGPLQSGMVDDFINRKHGRAQVAYPDAKYQHEKLKPILEPTYGVIVYQEQVMQIAQELAGYTLGGADMLRRAMGKKKPEEMAKQREIFAAGAKEQGVDPDLAMKIFDLVEKFAGYGFNKSHSAAYALVSYQTAWLKAHYPAQFMAATMSSDMDKTDKVVTFIEECRAMELDLVPPDVNLGSYQFSVDKDNRIIYGLGAIKGLGEGPIENIIAVRSEGGPFTDLFDFCSRVDPRKVNKRALEALVRSGALDSIGPSAEGMDGLNYSRAVMFNALDEAVKAAEQQSRNASAGMMDLFGEVVPSASDGDVYAEFRRARPWSIRERLEGEKNTLGLYLTGHPIDEYEDELQHLVKARIADLKPGREGQKVAGLVVAMRVMKTKRGDSMAIVTLDDRSGRIEAAVFSEAFGEHREKLVKDALLVLDGPISHDDYSGGLKMTVNGVSTLDELRQGSVVGVRLRLDSASAPAGLGKRIAACLRPYTNGPASHCGVSMEVARSDARGLYRLPPAWQVEPNDQLVQSLRELIGRDRVILDYKERR